MECSCTPYVGLAQQNGGYMYETCTNSYIQNSALDVVVSLMSPK